MSRYEKIRVPDIGDFDAVDVVEVLVTAGDRVKADDSLITLESDKATMDVPAPLPGVVVEVQVKAGDRVGQGAAILTLEVAESAVGQVAGVSEERPQGVEAGEVGTDQAVSESKPSPPAIPESSPPPPTEGEGVPDSKEENVLPAPSTKAYASPAVRRFGRELGVDLSRVRGSGRKGRILRPDVEAFVKASLAGKASPAGGRLLPEMPPVDFSKFGEVERQPLSRIQKISKENLHRSWLHIPHVTQHDQADITDLEAFRKGHGEEAKQRGFKLTPLAFIMKAAVAALEEHPKVNASLDPDGEHLVYKHYFHLGVAVDTEDGLVVPVIRDVNRKGVFDLAEELAEVSGRARERRLRPEDIRGASFTITSLGGIGGTAFTPIINAPEVAILGVSRSRMRPIWNGERFIPRLMLPISLSYDHRVVDGALAVRFTTYLCRVLADIRQLVL